METLLDENKPRLVALLGDIGLGKSAVARSACHFLIERRYFSGGVILLDLNSVKSFKIFENKMKKIMIKSLAKGKESSIHHKIRKAKDENFTDLLCEFFD